uniref:Uncharacterized protein n=1 Tax=Thermosporothrix sp. COM3 TaxID=2490863 RepID=A0A455SG14_9CHLR|nr:hypothetical protein KTC_14470 [Thermosporothrix sp. COM3]
MQCNVRVVRGILISILLCCMFLFLPVSSTSAREARPATDCYGQAETFSHNAAIVFAYPDNAEKWLNTSPYCKDINLKLSKFAHPFHVRVCFKRTNECTDATHITEEDHWYVLATSVRDETNYFLLFTGDTETAIEGMVAD